VTGVPGINHHEPNVDKCRPARSHSDRSPGSISLFPSLFLIFRSGLRPRPLLAYARFEGSACGGLMGVLYRSAPATHSACVLVGGLCFASMSGWGGLTARQA